MVTTLCLVEGGSNKDIYILMQPEVDMLCCQQPTSIILSFAWLRFKCRQAMAVTCAAGTATDIFWHARRYMEQVSEALAGDQLHVAALLETLQRCKAEAITPAVAHEQVCVTRAKQPNHYAPVMLV